MKIFLVILFLFTVHIAVFAQYDANKTLYPYEYDPSTFTSIPGNWDVQGAGHNMNLSKHNSAFITINLLDKGLYDLSCYKWYVEVVSVFSIGGRPVKFAWEIASIGNENLNRIADANYEDIVNTAPQKSYLGRATTESGDSYAYVNLEFDDFGEKNVSGATHSLRIIVVKKGDAGCGEEEVFELFKPMGTWAYSEAFDIDLAPPTSLEIKVPSTVLCSGSTTGNTTTATISGATGATKITLADAGKGGATFNPSYATVAGDVITILPTCPTGVYTVKATVTDDVPATAETEFIFTVDQTPTVTLAANNTTVCSGEGAELTATVVPSGTYTYKWEDKLATALTYSSLAGTGATQTLSDLLSTKDYRVIAANGNCKDTVDAPVRITVNPAPSFNIVPNSVTICQGEQVSLTATSTTGNNTGVTFAWNQGQSSTGPWTPVSGQTSSNLKVTPTAAGDIHYQVVGTLAGCSGKKEQKVTVNAKPNLNVTTQPTAVCDGAQVNLASAILTGSVGTPAYFSDKNCTVSSSSTVTVAAANSPKKYWIVVKNPSGCSDTAELTATVHSLPAKPTINGDTELCEGSSITLTTTQTAGLSYAWKAGGTAIAGGTTNSQIVSPTTKTSYTVVVKNANGCESTSAAHEVTVNKKPTVTITTPAAACAGSVINLTATVTGGGTISTYTWDNAAKGSPENTASATLVAGNNTYKLTVTDNKSCSGEGSITVTGNSIKATLTASPGTINAGNSSTLTAGFTPVTAGGQYEFWEVTPAKKIQAYSATSTCSVAPTETTTYRVIAKNTIGCIDSADATVTVQERPLEVIDATTPAICAGETTVSKILEFKATVRNGAKPYQSVAWTGLPTWVQVDRLDSAVIKITEYSPSAIAGTYPVTLTVKDKNGVIKSTSANLVVNTLPTILINGQASGDLAVCKNGTLTLTATGGTTYSWTAPSASAGAGATRTVTTITADATGTNYTVIGTDANGCTATVTRKVIINELPTISIDADQTVATVCSGGTATLAATGATTYSWSNGSGAAIIGPVVTTPALTAGTTYTVTGTDANGCTNTATQAVTVNPLPTVSFSTVDDDCAGSEINLAVTITGTTPYKNYKWSNNATAVQNDSIKAKSTLVAGANNYTFSVADANGCVGNASKSVNGIKYVVTPVANPTGIVIEGASVDITANVAPLEIFTYTFKQIAPVQADLINTGKLCNVTVTETSTYRAYIETTKGCRDSGDITIQTTPSELRIESSQVAEICQATEGTISGKELSVVVKGGTRPYVYTWSDITAGITTSSNNEKLAITAIDPTVVAGVKNIKVTVTDKNGTGTSITGTVALTVNAIPDVKINGVKTGVLNACVNDVLSLAVTPASGVTYAWSAPTTIAGSTSASQAINTAAPMSSTAYTVKVTDTKGCIAEATRDVVVNGLPPVTLITNKSGAVCAGTEVTLIPDGADSYTWSHGLSGDTQKVTPLVTTRYKLTGKNNTTGCSDTTSTLVIVNPLPTITVTQDPSGNLCVGSSVELTAGGAATYVWEDGTTTAKYVVSPTATTTYEVTGTDANGCVNKKQHAVNVQGKPLLTLNTPAPGCSPILVDLSALVKSSETTSGLRYKYYTSADVELTGNNIRVSVGGTYKVEGTTTEGCSTGKIEVEVVINPQPEITLTADKLEYCSGDTVELTAAVSNPNVITYAWNRSELGTASTAKDCPIATTASRSIEYSVTATLTATGCNRTEKTSVTINPRPQLSGVFTPLTNPIPEGFSLTLAVTSRYGEPNPTYTWVTPAAGSGNSATATALPLSCDFKVFAVDAKGCKSDTLKKSVTVTPQGGILDATINKASEFVCNNGMTVLTAEPKNGKADYHYSWVKSGSESTILGTDKILNVTTAGTYKVTVTDKSSPVQTKTVEIAISSTPSPAPVANAGADQTIAQGSSTVLFGSATSGVAIKSYVWSPQDKLTADKSTANPTTTILTGLQTYTLYVKDEDGCISMPDEVEINVNTTNPTIRVEASPATICIDNTSQFRVVAENGTLSAPTYEWTPSVGLENSNSASPTFKGTAVGTYSFVVKVTDGSNVYGAKVAVTVKSDKAPILAFDNAVNCAGDELTVKNTGTTVSGTGYKWIIDGVVDASSTGTKCALPVGTHNVTVIASGTTGCASDSVKTTATIHALPVIQFAAGNQTTVVDGTSFNMVAEATGASIPVEKYNWTLPTVITGGSDTYVATASGTSMTFTLTGESAEGCESAPITTVVQVTPSGDRLKVTANIESEVVCVGGAAYLNATASKGKPGYKYKWFVEGMSAALSTDSTYIAKPTASTNYVVQVTDSELTLAYDTVRLTIGANLAPQVDAGQDMSVLAGNTTVLFGSGTGGTGSSYIYVWSPLDKLSADATTANPRTVGLTSAQMYTLYVIDENGCKSKPDDVQVSVITDGDFFAIEATASPQSICLGNTSTLGVKVTKGTATDVTYLWTPNTGLSAANVASPKFTPSSAGTFDYYVTVTDKKGQRTSDKVTITVTPDNAPKIAFDGTPRCVGDTIHVKHTGTPVPVNYDRFVSFGGNLQETKNTLNNFYNFAQPGNYNVKFIAHAGVCNSDTISGNYTIGTMLNATVTPEYLVEAKNAVHNFEVTAPVGGYSYEWSGVVYNAAGAVDGSAANPVDASTKNNAKMTSTALKGDVRYIVKVTDDAGVACPASDTVWAYILPDAPSIDIDTAENRVTAKIQWNTTDAWSDGLSIMGRKWDPYCMTSDDGGKYNQVHTTLQGIGNWSIPSMDTLEFYYATSYRIIPAVSATTKHYAKETSDTVGYIMQVIKGFTASNSSEIRPGGHLGRVNYMSYPFDMTAKGVEKAEDVFTKLLGIINGKPSWQSSYIAYHQSHRLQHGSVGVKEENWDMHSHIYIDGIVDEWDNISIPNFNLVPGDIYQITVADHVTSVNLLMFGKLPQKRSCDFVYIANSKVPSDKTTENFFAVPLSLLAKLKSVPDNVIGVVPNTATLLGDEVSPEIVKKIEKVSVWSFEKQKMISQDYIQMDGMPEFNMWTPPLEALKIRSFFPVSVQMNDDILNWKK